MICRYLLLGALLALCINVRAGVPPEVRIKDFKSATSRTDFSRHHLERSDADAIADFLKSDLGNLKDKRAGISLKYVKQSPGGSHYTFTQTFMGVPVFSSDILVNVDLKGDVYSLFDDSYDVSGWTVDMTDFSYATVPALLSYQATQKMKDATITAQRVVAYDESANTPVLCYYLELRQDGRLRYALVAGDHIVYERDGAMYRAAPQDSLVTGMVFRPDPLTTAHTVYYGPYMGHDSAYQNFNDTDTPQLNLQRIAVPFVANYQAGTFSLQNRYVQMQSLGSSTPPVTSVTPTFSYTRSQNGFLDVMAYYHINTIRQYIHDLGFDMGDTLVTPDAHAFSADNSYFTQPQSIMYGTGGVPDAQDADVIVHEYTHFLSFNANHSNQNGSFERSAIDEGLADYNASSYSASIDTFGWYRMFSWDGHNEYWNGRLVNDRTIYPMQPSAPGLNGFYKYSVIWSSALMQIWFDLGRGTTDSLVYETMYGLAANITLPDAAHQLILADSTLYGGRYHCIIVRDLRDHGLASDISYCGIHPAGLDAIAGEDLFAFTGYPDRFYIQPSQPGADMHVVLYDMTGQRVAAYSHVSSAITPEGLPAGVYVIVAATGSEHRAFKWALVR